MSKWFFIIPFFYGKNRHVVKKGGAPIDRKIEYLKQTIDSINNLQVNSSITVYVCDDASYDEAIKVHSNVIKIDCHPKHLPLVTVQTFQNWFNINGTDEDIIVFNEDDQIIYLTKEAIDDIENTKENVVFSPHRWAKIFLLFRIKKRPLFRLNGTLGILDNINKNLQGKTYQFNFKYIVQDSRESAYAACWFLKGNVFKTINFTVPENEIELESPSFSVFDSGIPVLKLVFDKTQPLDNFIVDHLSGYDYNKRIIKLFYTAFI
jgi:hypothetical protein